MLVDGRIIVVVINVDVVVLVVDTLVDGSVNVVDVTTVKVDVVEVVMILLFRADGGDTEQTPTTLVSRHRLGADLVVLAKMSKTVQPFELFPPTRKELMEAGSKHCVLRNLRMLTYCPPSGTEIVCRPAAIHDCEYKLASIVPILIKMAEQKNASTIFGKKRASGANVEVIGIGLL